MIITSRLFSKNAILTPGVKVAEWMATKSLLIAYAMRTTCTVTRRRESLMRAAGQEEHATEIKISILKKEESAFPIKTDHEMTAKQMLELVCEEVMKTKDLSPGKGSDISDIDAKTVRGMSFSDDKSSHFNMEEDDEGWPIPPPDMGELMTPGPIWDDGDRKVLQDAVTSTQPPAMMRSGDQKLLIKLRQLGKDMTDPIKSLVAAHEERAAARKQ